MRLDADRHTQERSKGQLSDGIYALGSAHWSHRQAAEPITMQCSLVTLATSPCWSDRSTTTQHRKDLVVRYNL